MPLGPVQAGLAERMGGGAPPAPPQPAAPMGPGGGMQGPQMQPPGMEAGGQGGDPVQRLAEALGEARMSIGEMGPELFATQGKDLLRGFVGSVTQLQMEMSGGGAQAGPPGMPPGPQGPGMAPGPAMSPAPAGFPPGA